MPGINEEAPKIECYFCKNKSLTWHCPGRKCGWWKCLNKMCDAMLDPKERRGHHLDPSREIDPRTKTVPRIRVVYLAGVWEPRDKAS